MKHLLLMLAVIFTSSCCTAQTACDTLALGPDERPQFPGGNDSLRKYIRNSFRFPSGAEVTGTVWISIIVEEDGSISEVQLLKGLIPSYDEEALRMVRSMPRWIPASFSGKPIQCSAIIPVKFKIH